MDPYVYALRASIERLKRERDAADTVLADVGALLAGCDGSDVLDQIAALLERNERLEREREALREALDALSRDVEQDIEHRDYRRAPDYACAECVPHSRMLIGGFRCARHHAVVVLAQFDAPEDARRQK